MTETVVMKNQEEELSLLHDAYTELLEGKELEEYLLDCQTYLLQSDVVGWKKRFGIQETEIVTPPPAPKRRKMCPNTVLWTPHPACVGCGSKEVVEDVREATVVCTMCGMIQSTLIGTLPVIMSADHLARASRHVVHRYSRIVYFRSFILSMVGMTDPQITPSILDSLRRTIVGSVSKESVIKALRQLGLLVKYRRHAVSLAAILDRDFKPVVVPGDVFIQLLRLFRRVEYYWENDGHKRRFRERRVFYSYPYVYYQLCYHIGRMDLTGTHHLLKSRKLLSRLHASYQHLADDAGLVCDTSVYRDAK